MIHHGHLVLGEGAGLIRADHLRAAEGLHGGELADDRLAAAHLGHAQREHDGHHGHQALGDGGDGERHGHHEGVEQIGRLSGNVGKAMAQDVHGKDHHADHDDELGEDVRELGELYLQRRQLLLGLVQRAGDLAHLGAHTRAHHDGATAAVDHGGAHVAHVLAVAERHVVGTVGEHDGIRVLLHRHGLAGQRGLLDLHGSALEDTAVRGHGVAGLEQDHVTGDKLGAVHHDELTVADDLGLGGAHLLQGGQGLLALCLLDDAQGRVDDDDGHDDDHVGKVGLTLDEAGDGGDGGGHDQHDDHRVGHLLEEPDPHGRGLFLIQLVGAVLGQALGSSGGGETGLLARTEPLEHARTGF